MIWDKTKLQFVRDQGTASEDFFWRELRFQKRLVLQNVKTFLAAYVKYGEQMDS